MTEKTRAQPTEALKDPSLTAPELVCVCAVLSHVMFQASTSEWLARLDLALAGVSEAIAVIAYESCSIISGNTFVFLALFVKTFSV